MTQEVLLAAVGIVVAGLIYFAGVQRAKLQTKAEAELAAARDGLKRRQELRARVVEEYAEKFATRADAGPHLLARLGLPQLRSDEAIRQAIEEIQQRTGHDPWEGYASHVHGVDLLAFFEKVAAEKIDLISIPVTDVVAQLR